MGESPAVGHVELELKERVRLKIPSLSAALLLCACLVPSPARAQAIFGQLLDYNGQAVSSASRGGKLSLYKINPSSAQEVLVNSTKCISGGQGCVDASGIWMFTSTFTGSPLTAGRYVILAEGNFLLSRYQEVGFNVPALTKLALNPILLLTLAPPQDKCTVTSTGLTCKYALVRKLESVQQGPATIPIKLYADVHTPNITSPNLSLSRVDLPTQSFALGEAGPTVTFAYTFPAGSPAGFTSCLVVRGGADQEHIYREALPRCVVKP